MHIHRGKRLVLAGCLLAGLLLPAYASSAQTAPGERSWTRPAPAAQFRLGQFPKAQAARLQYGEVSPARLLKLQRDNAARRIKPTQVGIARRAGLESPQAMLPALKWVAIGRAGSVARAEVRSPDALALRVGLQVDRLDDRVELRFAGSDAPTRVVAVMTGGEIKRLLARGGLFWTPSTDGETQVIEIYRPAGVPADSVRLQAPQLSHLVTNSRNDFKLLQKIGESGTCNIDTSCRIGELGPRFVDAKNAVAHMQFVQGGSTYMCTGTLVADTVAATQVPYFYSANHCFAAGSGAPVAQEMQAVASTLNTFWNYEATACGSGVSTSRTQVSGGATYLYSDEHTDAMLVRLNNPAPAGAFFAGWTAEPLAASSAVLAIHHPAGDAKKVSGGQHVSTDANHHTVGWTQGTTEGGSSGSALFTLGGSGYELRGGLYGGYASCANAGSMANAQNRDWYSRFDVVYPRVSAHLAPEAQVPQEPIELNGGAPMIPPTTIPEGMSSGAEPATPVRPSRRPVPMPAQRGLPRQELHR